MTFPSQSPISVCMWVWVGAWEADVKPFGTPRRCWKALYKFSSFIFFWLSPSLGLNPESTGESEQWGDHVAHMRSRHLFLSDNKTSLLPPPSNLPSGCHGSSWSWKQGSGRKWESDLHSNLCPSATSVRLPATSFIIILIKFWKRAIGSVGWWVVLQQAPWIVCSFFLLCCTGHWAVKKLVRAS